MPNIRELLAAGRTVSFEFFPPKSDEAQRALEKALAELAELRPSFVSVTCGAGGQGHERTRDIVVDVARTYDFPAMPHLTCVGHTRAEVEQLLDDYASNGVTDILALAGDPPADGSPPRGDFTYATDLLPLIRRHEGLAIGVAAHPEVHPRSVSRASDRNHLARKLSQADFAITQFFFSVADYHDLVESLAERGCDKPVIPGVFPVTAPKTVRRFAAMNGTRIPESLFARIEAASEEERMRIAVAHATELAQALLDGGAPGLHIYTMNRSEAATRVYENLDLA